MGRAARELVLEAFRDDPYYLDCIHPVLEAGLDDAFFRHIVAGMRNGVLAKYAKLVSSASEGAVTR